MSDTYTKLFSSITESTVWGEPYATRIVWVTMLAMADARGNVYGSVPGLARRANVTRDECDVALASFCAPDRDSRTPDHDGRRIEPIDGGWRLLNHGKYSAVRAAAERRDYKREWDQVNRPSGHARQSDNSPTTVRHGPTSPTNPTPPTPTPTPENQKKERQDGRRGMRLPDGWQPSEAVREWARSEFPAVSLDDALAEFVDYWRSIPGVRGRKLDWNATFRNRVRELAGRARNRHETSPRSGESLVDAQVRKLREISERTGVSFD